MIYVWLGVAVSIGVAFRKAGPWWRVSLASLAWPALPLVAGVSKYRHARRRKQVSS